MTLAFAATAAPIAAIHAAPGFIETMQVLVVDSGIKLVAAIVILCLGWTLATYAKSWLDAGLARLPMDATLKPLLAQLVRYAILVITFVLVMEQFGVQTTSLIAVLGAMGLAIGLAMQGTLSNVAAGVMLLILRPFRVGHFIAAGSQQGLVREIGLFTTLLVTRDLVFVSVPNSAIFGGTITNYTKERLRRVVFTVPVDSFNDLDGVEKLITATLAANPLVIKEPEPSTVVAELQGYAVVMKARAYVRSPDYWKALYGLQKDVQRALRDNNVLIAVNRAATVTRNEALSPLQTQADEETESPTPKPATSASWKAGGLNA